MKIIIFLLLTISLLLPQRIEAGIADTAIKGAGIYLIFQGIGVAVRKGSPIVINFAVKKLKKYIIKNPHKIPIINGIASAYIIENSDISNIDVLRDYQDFFVDAHRVFGDFDEDIPDYFDIDDQYPYYNTREF